jgi:hypothetical protein
MSEEIENESLELALEDIKEDAIQGIIESLKEIEQQIFDQHGDPDTSGEVWALVSTADRDETDSFEEDKVEAVMTGKGPDLYVGLQSNELAVVHSLVKGKIGSMVRSGAWMGPTDGHRPSDHPDKRSCIISCSFVSNHIFFVIRFDDNTIEASCIDEVDYMEGRSGGQQRLVDSLLDFDYLPTALKEHEYDEYMRIFDGVMNQINEENDTE